MESTIFSCGRYRNQTYQHVLETEVEFCEKVLKGHESPSIPEDFKEFLMTKYDENMIQRIHAVKERTCGGFVKSLSPELKSKFRELLRNVKIEYSAVHPCSEITASNFFLSGVYQAFIWKLVSNITDNDCNIKFINDYSAIFPFKVSEMDCQRDADILKIMDDDLLQDLQDFLNQHFDNVEIRYAVNQLFFNISNFLENNFTVDLLTTSMKEMCLMDRSRIERCEYLRNFPRVNKCGAHRLRTILNTIVAVSKMYQKPIDIPSYKKANKHFMNLPETNLLEIFSLVNPDFFQKRRREYLYRLMKYLFFFVNALKHSSKPVFFIDEGLFECLLSLRTFVKSRDDVLNLKYELSMMSAVLLRKKRYSSKDFSHSFDDANFRRVKNYIENLPKISSAVLNEEIHHDFIESRIIISTDNTCMNTRYSKKGIGIDAFFKLVMHAALSSKNIEKLVFYNALKGEECTIKMPSNKEEIIDFIRTYNKYDFSKAKSPEEFLMKGLEKFYYKQ